MRKFVSMGSGYHSTSTRIAVGLFTLLAGHSAVAGTVPGGTITYGPLSATAVPTMSGFALILLAALMLVVVARVLKSRQLNGTQFMLAALVTGAIASGASGIKLVSGAYAVVMANPVSLSNPAGGTANLGLGLNCVNNLTGVAQQIVNIQKEDIMIIANNGGMANVGAPPTECPEIGGNTNSGLVPVPECSDDPRTVLQPDGTCAVFVDAPPSPPV
jgi:hypothetical protein